MPEVQAEGNKRKALVTREAWKIGFKRRHEQVSWGHRSFGCHAFQRRGLTGFGVNWEGCVLFWVNQSKP